MCGLGRGAAFVALYLIAGFALSACGGGGSHAAGPLPSTPANSGASSGAGLFGTINTAPAPGAVAANVSITVPIPKQTSSSKRRGPQFVSSFTQGIALEALQNGVYSGFEFFPVGQGLPGCTQTSSSYTCPASVYAPPGNVTILVGAFDQPTVGESGPNGNLLSAADYNATISPGRTNNLTITLLPVGASIASASSPPRCPVVGTPVNESTTYTAYDADGDDLSGLTLFNAITLANVNPADSSSGFSVPATITTGSGTFTYGYDGNDTNVGIFQLAATAGPGTGGTSSYAGIFASIPVIVAGPHYVYVGDAANNQILQYDGCANSQTPVRTFSLPASPVDMKFDRNSPANDERLFILMSNNALTWLDVEGSPGTFIQTIGFAAPVHEVRDSDSSAFAWVTVGNNLKKISVAEGTAGLGTLTVVNQAGLTNPIGFSLEGTGNDMLVGQLSGFVQAVNPTTMVLDGSVSLPGIVTKISGPNSNASCALGISSVGNFVSGIAIPALGGPPSEISYGIAQGPPVAAVFFPPVTGAGGSVGYGTNTAIVAATAGAATLFNCDGVTFNYAAQWTTFMAQPAAMASSEYASLAVGSLVYVTGLDQGVPVLQAFTSSYDHDLGSLALPSNANPIAVTVGR
jgi:hypothetical protein